MKRKRFTEEQIINILTQHAMGVALPDDVRRLIKKAQTHAVLLASLARLDYELGSLAKMSAHAVGGGAGKSA